MLQIFMVHCLLFSIIICGTLPHFNQHFTKSSIHLLLKLDHQYINVILHGGHPN